MKTNKADILLIEDNVPQANLIREMLSELDFTLLHAQYLSQGLRLLQEKAFDVILVDLGLPDSQGLETALTVRKQAKLTPVIALTSLDDEEIALKSLQMDIQDYLIKDEITGSMLARAIRYAIQRKNDSELLRESEDRFSSFMLHLPAAAWIKDKDGRYVYVNAEAERILSAPLASLHNKSDEEIFPPETVRQTRESDRRIWTDGGSLQTETQYMINGIEHHGLVRKFAILGSDGQPAYVAGIALDITERKQVEKEIERLNADLAERAAELETVNDDLEAFNHTVAHDLRQPLNAISGFCQAIKMLCSDQTTECSDLIKGIYQTALRMDRLIGTLVSFSHMSRIELRLQTVNLSARAHAVAEELKQADPERQVDFRIADGIGANADENLLRVVFDNLLGNAWKYTATRELGVIEFDVTDTEGQRVFFVRDNGAGFDMEYADQLFTPFKRLPGVEEKKGFGIGLATVERIIHRHGGKVWAEGAPDKGACFYFTLPTPRSSSSGRSSTA